jgi:ribonuclease HII
MRSADASSRRREGSRRCDGDLFAFDRDLLRGEGKNLRFLAGADEVGRGCLAGPLVCAAVVLDYALAPQRVLTGLRDSKLLTVRRRHALYDAILAGCARWSVVSVSAASLDARGLHRSNLAALASVLQLVEPAYDVAVVDGFDVGREDLRCRAVVGGDGTSAAVAAASVVAKVTRDRLMHALHQDYPAYGFDEHVGYATRRHREALAQVGVCPLHRLSFAGVGTGQLSLPDMNDM